MNRVKKIKEYMPLHACILWYTTTSLLSKFASNFDFLSWQYILCLGGIFLSLGSYAIMWQQVIKRYKPSIGYSNKSVSLIWTMIFSCILFDEQITITNVLGALVIVGGVIMVSQSE